MAIGLPFRDSCLEMQVNRSIFNTPARRPLSLGWTVTRLAAAVVDERAGGPCGSAACSRAAVAMRMTTPSRKQRAPAHAQAGRREMA